ncbi:hypothetical protein NPIL_311251 [Nephila pilipes]|uniref:Uncharacterized protein n=1 Tax=Nephila pilipes TaxID=299642 RepID=A0A8X6NS31_NEPPI|nr:hypothetical protein NPIL_311251 [Nephila pilipes]
MVKLRSNSTSLYPSRPRLAQFEPIMINGPKAIQVLKGPQHAFRRSWLHHSLDLIPTFHDQIHLRLGIHSITKQSVGWSLECLIDMTVTRCLTYRDQKYFQVHPQPP